jgi:hypothetical protein
MITLDAYERWLLEMVVELHYPLELICDAALPAHLNRPGHGLASDEIVARMSRLHEAGLLEFLQVRGRDERVVPLSSTEISAHVVGLSEARLGDGLYFGLTPAGGVAWEQTAEPDWSRYLVDEVGDEMVITAQHRELVETYLLVVFGAQRSSRSGEQWEEVSPWRATYWKKLPSGARCRFPIVTDRIEAFDAGRDERLKDLRRWFTRVELPASPA